MAPQTQTLFHRKCSSSSASLLTLSLISIYFFQSCNANSNCSPSTCGIFRNISFPFRLKDDPRNCGDYRYELACENNVTFVYLNSHKFYVKTINYDNSIIRLVDASLSNDTCSFPLYSGSFYPYPLSHYHYFASPIYFISCANPLQNSPFFTDITSCGSNSSHHSRYTYTKIDFLYASNLTEGCRLEMTMMSSSEFKYLENISLSEIHQALLYGFELIWCFECPTPDGMYQTSTWDITHDCASSNSSHPTRPYTYIKVGRMKASNLSQGGCSLEIIVPTSWEFKDLNNISLSEIRLSHLYGFELNVCIECVTYQPSTWDKFVDFVVLQQKNPVSVLLVMAVLCSAVISSPVMIIFAIVVAVGIALKIVYSSYWSTSVHIGNVIIPSLVMIGAPRFLICPLIVWLLIHKFRTRHSSMYEAIESFLQSDNKLAPIRYSYSDLKKMTRGFRDKLGEGGFGSVYKGKLRSGHHVAVKVLGETGGNGQDFINEIATIGRIHHVNVVQLVGYCAERSKRGLVFDFMPNGSLEKYLFNREKLSSLNWETKLEIAVGVARGIEYLHRGCDIQILHFDIKPHNILLDDKFIPKITDFGLAKFCSIEKKTVTMTAARGTIGYVAPELISRSIGAVSYKVDVYSFGMLLIEMVGLNREIQGNSDESSKYFPGWIYDRFNQGMDIEVEVREETNGIEENESGRKSVVRKMTIVALWCIQMNPDERPSMNKVLQMLEGDVDRLQIPKYPSQSAAHVAVNEEESWGTDSTYSVSLLRHNVAFSRVEITIEE